MEIHSYKDMAEMERGNWWYVSRRALLERLFHRFVSSTRQDALDLGCGVGSHHSLLKKYAKNVDGVDLSVEALSYAKNYPYRELKNSPAEKLPLEDGAYDVVLCADVIEHVEDQPAMKEIARVLRQGGLVFLTTPAFPSLWHENDDYSHHKRRYRKIELLELVRKEGLTIEYVGYWNMIFFPVVWLSARLYHRDSQKKLSNNLSRIPSWANHFFEALLKIERWVSTSIPLPFGASLVLVARKK